MFDAVFADFANSVGVGKRKRAVIQLERAGWHGPQNITLPDGVRLAFQPSQSPGRQPVERLWQFVDEPFANTHFGTIDGLDKTVGAGCVALMEERDIRATCWREIGFTVIAPGEAKPAGVTGGRQNLMVL